ncbi:hypothetical protein [Streptomyces mirabilis]
MSISGTDAHAATDPAALPPLVRRALVELRLAEDLATLVGTRRRLAPTGLSSSSE